MRGRVTWARRIGSALKHDGFVLLAQPIVELATGTVGQYELLLRMRESDGSLILPSKFLHTAERLGMIQEIDRWVVCEAIRVLTRLAERGSSATIGVNLSGISIGDPDVLALVGRELDRSGVDPSRLLFEVTETAAVLNMARAGRFAAEVTRMGCRFALDDFGAGYGSFYYLKHLPFDFLKIDGEFVKDCLGSETDRLLIKASVDIAIGMGKQTIAECVGDRATVDLLMRLGVRYGQGFFLGRPAPLEEIRSQSRAPSRT
jgi:EAL domain-containing protein (putative c-di-GMP-specific phosphodiesterase class I)